MKIKEVRQVEAQKRVQLERWEKISHYLLPIILLGSLFYGIVRRFVNPDQPVDLTGVIVIFSLGFIFFFIQWNALRFEVFSTNKERKEILRIIRETGRELKWDIYSVQKHSIQARTNPKWTSGSWGEMITIYLIDKKVYVNSICDPGRFGAIYSNGRNRKNVETLKKNLKRPTSAIPQP